AAGNGITASTSTDNSVTFDATPPTVTINQAAGQGDPTSAAPITFTAVFSEPVSGFTGSGVTISGTAGGTKTVTVKIGRASCRERVNSMVVGGTVKNTIGAGVATDAAGNGNSASTSSNNNTTCPRNWSTVMFTYDAGQGDPTSAAPITFTAVFSKPVSGFTGSGVTISGTAGGTKTVTV